MRVLQASLWACAYVLLYRSAVKADPNGLSRRQDPGATTSINVASSVSGKTPELSPDGPSKTRQTSPSEPVSYLSSGSAKPTSKASDIDTPKQSSASNVQTGTGAGPSITSAINGPGSIVVCSGRYKLPGTTGGAAITTKDHARTWCRWCPSCAVRNTIHDDRYQEQMGTDFFSTGLLTSLAITVLLIYIMNPPVRLAVQGAYLVAAFMTGAIFGAGSLVFKEVTEGLGCLLGGFCLSMWLLALQPGGLLRSTRDKVILIAVFTIASYASSFQHKMRPYSLIGATSFAGATAVVIGIDCFSKAGLKEFWLYIWDLNDRLFPLNTVTYPITRGIRVELAVIVLLCLLGVISQAKLWKVIKDRRERKVATRLDDERERERVEESIGRRLEAGNEREKVQWEAAYGNRDDSKRTTHTDSGLGTEVNNSLRKASVSVREVGESSTPAEVEEPQANGSSDPSPGVTSNSPPDSAGELHDLDPGVEANSAQLKTSETRTETTRLQGPPILPLPFMIPSREEPKRSRDCSASSIAERQPEDSVEAAKVVGQALVQDSLWKRRGPDLVSESEDAFVINAIHSRGSSLAATIDDVFDEHEHRVHSHEGSKGSGDSPTPPKGIILAPSQDEEYRRHGEYITGEQSILAFQAGEESDPEELQRNIAVDHKPADATPPSVSKQVNVEVGEDTQAEDVLSESKKRLSLGVVSDPGSLTKGALDRVPSQLSHVVMSYRTNEWAKHISTANPPECDEPQPTSEDAPGETPAHLIEPSAPVDVEYLQRTPDAVVDSSSFAKLNTSKVHEPASIEGNRPYPKSPTMSKPHLPLGDVSRNNLNQPAVSHPSGWQSREGHLSLPDLSKSVPLNPQQSSLLVKRGLRNSSNPVPEQTLLTSPIDENAEAEFPQPSRVSVSPMPPTGSTLLSQRDSILRNKHSQISIRNSASTNEVMYPAPPARSSARPTVTQEPGSRSTSRAGYVDNDERQLPTRSPSRLSSPIYDDDDMPLAQRKAMFQQHRPSWLGENRLSSTDNFDAHLPQRSHSSVTAQKRESMFASWRESMRQDATLNAVPDEVVENRRAKLLEEQHRSKTNRQQSKVNKIEQENAIDQAMRKGDMQELHREAMRKMQANANKHVS